jgi:hypothetical protein
MTDHSTAYERRRLIMSNQREAQLFSIAKEVSSDFDTLGRYVVQAAVLQAAQSGEFGQQEWFDIRVRMVLSRNPAPPEGESELPMQARGDGVAGRPEWIVEKFCVCFPPCGCIGKPEE